MRSWKSFLIILVATAPVMAAEYRDGLEAAQKQDFAKAHSVFKQLAEQGHSGAQHGIGLLYQMGRGVPKDLSMALMWYRKAAAQESASAQNNIGTMYRDGEGVEQSYVEAARWYRMAIDKLAVARLNLGGSIVKASVSKRAMPRRLDYTAGLLMTALPQRSTNLENFMKKVVELSLILRKP